MEIDLMQQVLRPLAERRGLDTWEKIVGFTGDEWFPSRLSFGKFKGRLYQKKGSGYAFQQFQSFSLPFKLPGTLSGANYAHNLAVRLGRLTSTTQTNQSQIAYSYNPATLQLASETTRYDLDRNGIYEFSRTLDRTRDTLLRDSGFQLKTGTTLENQASYTYSGSDGRISQISNPLIPNQIFSYYYLPSSNLLSTVSGPIHTVTNNPHFPASGPLMSFLNGLHLKSKFLAIARFLPRFPVNKYFAMEMILARGADALV